jgi:hypothetical protein
MEILDGFPSCLARVDIAPPKLNQWWKVFLNPNETMAPRALQNERSNHNAKMKLYPSFYPSSMPSRTFPFLTKSNVTLIPQLFTLRLKVTLIMVK